MTRGLERTSYRVETFAEDTTLAHIRRMIVKVGAGHNTTTIREAASSAEVVTHMIYLGRL
jgi:hypothetical protein